MAQSENTVTIYQNGIAAFERCYEVGDKEPKRLSLPFKKDVIGDVAATISILGAGVEIVEAPNYPPTPKKPALELNPDNITANLFTKLSGAQVTITKTGSSGATVKGRVCGYTTENNVLPGGGTVCQHWITVLKDDGCFERLNLDGDVAGYTFTDPAIQTLITKALNYNVEKINPDSVYLSLALKGTKPTKAMLKYAIPSPAFKLTYRAKQRAKGGWTLYGYAVVDNDTDEDWTNFNVNCTTGQPVTFATDIAELRIPTRQKVNLVNESTVGAVEVESGADGLEALGARGGSSKGVRARGINPPMMAACAAPPAPEATQAVAETQEIGDLSFFRSQEPVTIPAKKSALVKIIEQKLKDAIFCLYYQPAKNDKLLMRALKMMNDATYTLGRGSCTVEQEGSHMGSAVLSMTKPGESAMLCHAQETGVKVLREVGQERQKCMKHSLAEGMLVTEWQKTRTTVYTFRNIKNESFTLLFDHQRCYTDQPIECDNARFVTTLDGNCARYSVDIPAKGNDAFSVTTVTVTETCIAKSSVKAGEFLDWMSRNPDSPLLKDRNLETVVTLYKELCGCNQEIITTKGRLEALKGEQDRIRKTVDTLSKVDNNEARENLAKVTARLVKSNDEIDTIEQATLPELDKKRTTLANRIRESVAHCTAGWMEAAAPIHATNGELLHNALLV